MNCVSISSDDGLSPVRPQAITRTNADLLSIGPLGTNFGEIGIKMQKLLMIKMASENVSAKWRPFCPGEDEFDCDICDVIFDIIMTLLLRHVSTGS